MYGEPIIDPRTEQPYVERQYSDHLLLALLRARRPGKFGNKLDLSATMPVMEPVVLVHTAPPAKT